MLSLPVPGRPAVRLLAVLVAGLALVAACTTTEPSPAEPGTRSALLDGRTWQLLGAGPDGMRGRLDFGGADGMLFDLEGDVSPSAVAFVMDGVSVPLAIAWFAADGSFVGRTAMTPCPAEPCQRYVAPAPFRWAIEARAGAFDDLPADARLELSPP
jgi:uncharacterized membrane protein (UPF0127 family)